jgi:hypothetical protein
LPWIFCYSDEKLTDTTGSTLIAVLVKTSVTGDRVLTEKDWVRERKVLENGAKTFRCSLSAFWLP